LNGDGAAATPIPLIYFFFFLAAPFFFPGPPPPVFVFSFAMGNAPLFGGMSLQ
jgi:hypothetical protein